jgi:hypothetical protein
MQSSIKSHSDNAQATPDLIQVTRLDAYFPFDPLILGKSKEYIQPHFQEWDDGDEPTDLENSESELSSSLQGMSLEERLSASMSLSLG